MPNPAVFSAFLHPLHPRANRGRDAGGPKSESLSVIYQVDAATASDLTLQEARTHEAVAKTAKIDLEREILEKTRIPIDVVEQEVGNVLAELKAVAKRHLDRPGQTEFFAACAKIPAKLGFCGE